MTSSFPISSGPGTMPRPAGQANSVLVVSSNADVRTQLAGQLQQLRWVVRQAESGAAAWLCQEDEPSAAVLLDEWLPDLSAREFAQQFLRSFPTVDMLSLQGAPFAQAVRSARRNELLLALRAAEDDLVSRSSQPAIDAAVHAPEVWPVAPVEAEDAAELVSAKSDPAYLLPDVLGASAPMQELATLVQLAAPHVVSVLIEGETGTGKELIARAVHRLSPRASKPFVTLNCAAIPEQLLEAELFGHTRGAFTGAFTSRTGRIEAASGGTLFLDEIGEMPLPLQAKMLRFLESGEIQRIGDNELMRVDVRIVAATHQPLEQNSEQGLFRLDLYHRLAVFPVWVPPLRERMADLPMLVQSTLQRLGQTMPQRSIHADAMAKLMEHSWPGNVRELLHVLQRAVILSSRFEQIRAEHIVLRRAARRLN